MKKVVIEINQEEAKKLAELIGDAAMEIGDEYDWDHPDCVLMSDFAMKISKAIGVLKRQEAENQPGGL